MTARAALPMVDKIYGAATDFGHWPSALQQIAEYFDDFGAILLFQREDKSLGTICSPSLNSAQEIYERDEWWRHDVRFTRSKMLGYMLSKDAIADRHIASDDEIENLPFYTFFLAQFGLKWFGGISISPDPRIAVVLSILRLSKKRPFSDDELEMLTAVGRHVEQSLRLGIRLIDAENAKDTLAHVLARLGVGVFLLEATGRVVFKNAAADAMLGGNLQMRKGCLTSSLPHPRSRLMAALSACGEHEKRWSSELTDAILVPVEDSGGTLVVHVLPAVLSDGHVIDRFIADASAIAVVMRCGPSDPVDPSVLRDIFGLTLGEERVAALVGAGHGPRGASLRLGLTEESARTILKRVFAKTGVSRQNELATLLTRLAFR